MTDACQICGSGTSLLDVVDFNKSCEEARGLYLPVLGVPIYYAICDNCDFVFSPTLCRWPEHRFLSEIYNEDYLRVDPDYAETRPTQNARMLGELLGGRKADVTHLDYGGGNGMLAARLRQFGWRSQSYDPFPHEQQPISALGKFDLITAFEVFEHVPDARCMMERLEIVAKKDSVILFSTLTSDGHLKRNSRIGWWYCAPRNGHVAIHSRRSLQLLGERHGYRYASLNAGLHVFARAIPTWAASFLREPRRPEAE